MRICGSGSSPPCKDLLTSLPRGCRSSITTGNWRYWPRANGTALGVVHFFADPDKLRAEYAIAVRSDWKGRGVGFLLMNRLIHIARQRGIGSSWARSYVR